MTYDITIVSGLPRSGTSLMMKMLEAGGLPAYTDEHRKPDEDNPGGYYELEGVKRVREDTSWMDTASGKAFKMVSMLLYELPADRGYNVIFMERNIDEVVASQRRMLERMGRNPTDRDDEDAKMLFAKHLREVKQWLAARDNFRVLYVGYGDLMADPACGAEKVGGFLGGLEARKMADVVNPELYRNRAETPVPSSASEGLMDDDEEQAVKERLADLGYM